MQTECSAKVFEFEAVERRAVVAGFDGGDITSNAGALLLGHLDRGLGLVRRFAQCFCDRRDPRYVEHQVETLLGQRIFGLALGYEDLNDHDELRKDPTFAVLAGKLHPVLRSDCEALAGKSTLNRLEHTPKRHGSKFILRGDGGFSNDALMQWCEAKGVDYVFGLARNTRLEAAVGEALATAKQLCLMSGKPARVFRDFSYRTIDSWSRVRRVVGKAEHTLEGANPRFVVTSLKRTRIADDARALYEDLYCARGEAENRIGEQFELFADRMSSATMQANQLRMWFSAMAYVLVDTLRRIGLRHTQFADAAVQTIRLKLFKLGAQVRTSVRRIHFALASGCPNKVEFELAYLYLQRAFGSG
jgi:hypothetical protein